MEALKGLLPHAGALLQNAAREGQAAFGKRKVPQHWHGEQGKLLSGLPGDGQGGGIPLGTGWVQQGGQGGNLPLVRPTINPRQDVRHTVRFQGVVQQGGEAGGGGPPVRRAGRGAQNGPSNGVAAALVAHDVAPAASAIFLHLTVPQAPAIADGAGARQQDNPGGGTQCPG